MTKTTKPVKRTSKTVLGKIKKWNEDRGLLNTFNLNNEISFIIEECIEAMKDIDSKTARKMALNQVKLLNSIKGNNTTPVQMVDAFADMIVFATGAIYKLGYDADKVMKEVQKELDDRTGNMIDGKFIKDKKDSRYIADFSKCV